MEFCSWHVCSWTSGLFGSDEMHVTLSVHACSFDLLYGSHAACLQPHHVHGLHAWLALRLARYPSLSVCPEVAGTLIDGGPICVTSWLHACGAHWPPSQPQCMFMFTPRTAAWSCLVCPFVCCFLSVVFATRRMLARLRHRGGGRAS